MPTGTMDSTGTVFLISFAPFAQVESIQRVVHQETSVMTLTMDQRHSQSQRLRPSEILCWHSKWLRPMECFHVWTSFREGRVKYFNNMHSFSQLVLLSYGHTTTPPDNYMDFVSKKKPIEQRNNIIFLLPINVFSPSVQRSWRRCRSPACCEWNRVYCGLHTLHAV